MIHFKEISIFILKYIVLKLDSISENFIVSLTIKLLNIFIDIVIILIL